MQNINIQLYEVYRKFWNNLKDALQKINTVNLKISDPLLLYAFPEYEKAKVKLLIVGQQTCGWSDDSGDTLDADPIKKVMERYKNFHLGEKYKKSPFWYSSHDLYNKLNPDGPAYGFLWSNLIRVDQNCQRPKELIENVVCESSPLLAYEINLLKPDIVVFFTGPYYDNRLKKTFGKLTFEKVEGFRERVLSRIQHDGLPKYSFRTYHPNYLRLQRLLESVISKIINEVL